MARRRKPPEIVASPPGSLRAYAAQYLEWLRTRNYSEATIHGRNFQLDKFFSWAEARDIARPIEVTLPILEHYQRHLYQRRRPDGRPLSVTAQIGTLGSIRMYFKWLTRRGVLLSNPASEIELPRQEFRLPKAVLSIEEAERVLGQADVRTPLGLRDRAMLEVLYSTGMRRGELANIGVFDVDMDRGTIMIRQGKGKKDRMVPVGERALAWVERYLSDVRPSLVVAPDPQTLFLGQLGERLVPGALTKLARSYVDAADIGKSGACHLFRHTAATLMLENGADLRYIQQLLGHARVTTTQVYTQVSIRRLKQVHSDTHPGAKLKRREPSGDDGSSL